MSRFYQNSDMVPLPADEPATDEQLPDGAAGGTASAAGSPSPDGAAGQSTADDGAPAVPENIAELRKGQMYDPAVTFRQEIQVESAELPPEEVEAVNVELRRMAGDIGFSSQEAREVFTLGKAHSASLPDAATEATWEAEAMTAIQREYGAKAHEALDLGRALVERDPRIANLLDTLRLGSHPRVVKMLIQRAYAERKAGRL